MASENSYSITTIMKDRFGRVTFDVEKRKMRAAGPGAVEIINVGSFGTMVGAGNFLFQSRISDDLQIKSGSTTNCVNGPQQICVLRKMPDKILIGDVDYFEQWKTAMDVK